MCFTKLSGNQITSLSFGFKCWCVSTPLVSMMFQSFTEGELQHVVETLLDRKRRKRRRLGESQARRTKRARRPKPCSLRELELTVSELGLGYESDETVLLRYCSGKCTANRRNYDITMRHMMRTGFRKKGRKDKVSNVPCCRPVAFEKDFSFLDNNNRYHTIQNVSAKNCDCVWPREMDLSLLHTAQSLCRKSLTWMLLKDKLWNINSRRKEKEYVYGCSTAAFFDRQTLNFGVCHHMLGPNHMDSECCVCLRHRKWLLIPKRFYYLFYLCSNTVNCGVTTT